MTGTVLEEGRPLSRCCLFRLQRRFFETRGLRAWSEGIVPHYISSNPSVARAYGRVVLGFLRDVRDRIDPGQPVYVIELGAGAGRLGHHFLRQTREAFRLPALAGVSIRYVLTDFSEEHVRELRRNPRLQEWAAEGLLDFALFDAESPGPLRLLHGGEIISPETFENPLVVIANYVFDSLPQDVFLIEGGTLYESRVTVSSSQPEPDADDPSLLSRIELEYGFAPLAGAAYGEPGLDRLLEEYRQRLDGTCLLFPCAALRAAEFFRGPGQSPRLLLSADKGYVREESLAGRGLPEISLHGSVSLPMNYHALARYFERAGGVSFHTERLETRLHVCAFVSGENPDRLAETHHAFAEFVEAQGPDDFYSLKTLLDAASETLSAEQILAFLRVSGWDPDVFRKVSPRLLSLAPELREAERRELSRAAGRIWEAYLPIGEERNLSFELGVLLLSIGDAGEARMHFERSRDLRGPDVPTLCNLALCHLRLGSLQSALAEAGDALALDPGFEPARSLHAEVLAGLRGEPGPA